MKMAVLFSVMEKRPASTPYRPFGSTTLLRAPSNFRRNARSCLLTSLLLSVLSRFCVLRDLSPVQIFVTCAALRFSVARSGVGSVFWREPPRRVCLFAARVRRHVWLGGLFVCLPVCRRARLDWPRALKC